jgi:hypothetical protein
MKTILATLALIAPLLASAATVEPTPCYNYPATQVNCVPLVVDGITSANMVRYSTSAGSFLAITLDNVVYTTLPSAWVTTSVATGPYDANQNWVGQAYSGAAVLSFNLNMHTKRGICSGRGCRTPYSYSVLGGSLQ